MGKASIRGACGTFWGTRVSAYTTRLVRRILAILVPFAVFAAGAGCHRTSNLTSTSGAPVIKSAETKLGEEAGTSGGSVKGPGAGGDGQFFGGGDSLRADLETARQILIQVVKLVDKQPGTAGLCQCVPGNSDARCSRLNLPAAVLAECQSYLKAAAPAVLALNGASPTEFVIVEDLNGKDVCHEIAFDGKEACTPLSSEGKIEFARSRLSGKSVLDLLDLVAHEFGHKFVYRGSYVDDSGMPILPDLLGAAVVAYSIQNRGYRAAVLLDDPTAYFKLDENAGSATCMDVTATPSGCVVADGVVLGVPGAISDGGTAANLKGTSLNSILLTLDDPPQAVASVELWVNPRDRTTGRILMGFDRYALRLWSHGGLAFIVQGFQPGDGAWSSGAGAIATGKWSHLVVVFRAGDPRASRLYVNGTRISLSADPGYEAPIAELSARFKVGGSHFPFIYPDDFHGDVDEIAIYRRELSQAEISNHYLRGVKTP